MIALISSIKFNIDSIITQKIKQKEKMTITGRLGGGRDMMLLF